MLTNSHITTILPVVQMDRARRFYEEKLGLLPEGAPLYLYGPYRRSGRHTAPSNESFDESLRSRNPEWGVRDLEQVTSSGEARGLRPVDVVGMPANNLSVVFRKLASQRAAMLAP